ncbi:iron-containing redox enzyme family protein [Kineococcus sp. GCM10028916]|uniref:iron-containing redox enzyme family protein n=1 Tax=Kineococcus sp. GCM10028916 TaxID=3273394 RepID=UPI0036340E91
MARHGSAVRTLPRSGRLPLPPARGPLSDALTTFLLSAGGEPRQEDLMRLAQRAHTVDVLRDEDVQLTLLLLYELHHEGIDQVVDDLEWDLGLLWVRADLEMALQRSLQVLVHGRHGFGRGTRPEFLTGPARVDAELVALATARDATGLTAHLALDADLEQFREFFVHHSLHHLVPFREVHSGDPRGTSGVSTTRTTIDLGLDDAHGAYVSRLPATSLAAVNTATMFGLHRRDRGALAGHLAFSHLSSPSLGTAVGDGLRRLGLRGGATGSSAPETQPAQPGPDAGTGRELVASLLAAEPELAADVVFGARAGASLARLVAEEVLGAWSAGTSSLLPADHHDDAPDSHQVLRLVGRRPRG